MASTIGQAAMPNADGGPAVPHPESYFRGSTSGMGGASSEVHERYDPIPTHHFRMQPGNKMFTRHYRAREIGPAGTWGQATYRKYNPVKQIGGASGYLNQDPRSYVPSRDMPARTLGRVVNSQFLPRGGSVPRVVGTAYDYYTQKPDYDPAPRYGGYAAAPDEGTPADDMASRRAAQVPGEILAVPATPAPQRGPSVAPPNRKSY